MSLMIKVTKGDGYVMDEYLEAPKTAEYLIFCYFGGEGGSKPYNEGQLFNLFFIERDKHEPKLYSAKILDIIPGPKHGGKTWDDEKIEKELQHIPPKFKDDLLINQEGIAFHLKFKDINLIRKGFQYDKQLKNFYYDRYNKPYIPKKCSTPVTYVSMR